MISILFLLINLLSEMRELFYLFKSSSFVLLVQRLIQRKEERTFFTYIAKLIEVRYIFTGTPLYICLDFIMMILLLISQYSLLDTLAEILFHQPILQQQEPGWLLKLARQRGLKSHESEQD